VDSDKPFIIVLAILCLYAEGTGIRAAQVSSMVSESSIYLLTASGIFILILVYVHEQRKKITPVNF
jgi:hypothetical protein